MERAQILFLKDDLSRISGLKLHDGAGERGLAATGFSYEPKNLTFFKAEAYTVDCADGVRNAAKGSLSNREVGVNINEFEEWHGGMKALNRKWNILNFGNLL